MAFTRPRLSFETEDAHRLTFAWGDLSFEADGVAMLGMRFSIQHAWARLARFGSRAAAQYTGTDLESLSLSGVIMLGGLDAFDALRAAGNDIEPHTLVDVTGRTWGRYALTRLTADVQQMTPTGDLRQATWSLEFVQVPEESDAVRTLDETDQGVDLDEVAT